jgi:hypothetical protein
MSGASKYANQSKDAKIEGLTKRPLPPGGRVVAPRGPLQDLQRSIGNLSLARFIEAGGPARPELSESANVRKAIHAAILENRTTAPPSTAAFSIALKRVSVRDDASADRSTRLLKAAAVAVGEQIMFRHGYYESATESGRALIAHELTHIAHQIQIGRSFPQRFVGGDVLSVQFSPDMAKAMDDNELPQQMQLLRSHLTDVPGDAAAKENLATLERETYRRQGTAGGLSLQPAAIGASQPDQIARMTSTDKLVEAFNRAKINEAARKKISSLFTPQSLALAIVSTAAVFVASQFTPVGWTADIALGLTAIFISTALLAAIDHLIKFADARNAASLDELDAAGAEFAAAIAEIEVDAILFLLTHRVSGGEPGELPGAGGAAPTQVRLGVTPEGEVIPVRVDTIPANISANAAAALGVKASIATGALMSVASSPGGPTSSGGSKSRDVEKTYLDRLKERYPKLKNVDIRPRARPLSGRYTVENEDVSEVGAPPERRTEVGGAPEHAFEERMQTSQSGYSYGVYDRGQLQLELDGISVDGWVEEIKIEQKLRSVDEIVAQLRRRAEFAEAYGLKGVHYSIAPPNVGAEVESRVAAEQLKNVYRVE